jgi:hypothetical protein
MCRAKWAAENAFGGEAWSVCSICKQQFTGQMFGDLALVRFERANEVPGVPRQSRFGALLPRMWQTIMRGSTAWQTITRGSTPQIIEHTHCRALASTERPKRCERRYVLETW